MVKTNKIKSSQFLLVLIAGILAINYLGNFVFTRFDLTSENRYSLSEPSKKLLQQLDSTLLFTIYLEGDFPADFKRLQRETKEMLDEFRAYNSNLDYEFVNLNDIEKENKRTKAQFKLVQKGIQPYPIKSFENGEEKRTVIFPAAILTYKGKETVFSILKAQQGLPELQMINNSVNTLEYRIANSIKEITQTKKPAIAFLEGHNELNDYRVADISYALSKNYVVRRGAIENNLAVLDGFKCVIIAKPTKPFTETEKFVLDRYVMKGGKIIWMLDGAVADMDSIRKSPSGSIFSIPNDLNLNDQLFKYGVRVNGNLLKDQVCGQTPMVVGEYNNQPKIEQVPWAYYPLLIPKSNHVTTKNLSPINTEFPSTIDTIKTKGVTKTILLQSSDHSKVIQLPAEVSIREAENQQYQYATFVTPPQNVAVLLEGTFTSVFKNRPIPTELKVDKQLTESVPNKMIVISDGDLVKNDYNPKTNQIQPMYDNYFGNKDFFLNCVDYLIDDTGLIEVRNKEVKLRLLNKNKVKKERTFWQFINVGLPILLILIWGLANGYIRKRKYS